MVATLVAWPPAKTIASSVPRNEAISASSSWCSGVSPHSRGVAELDVP